MTLNGMELARVISVKYLRELENVALVQILKIATHVYDLFPSIKLLNVRRGRRPTDQTARCCTLHRAPPTPHRRQRHLEHGMGRAAAFRTNHGSSSTS